MTLEARVVALAQAMGADVKELKLAQGVLGNLTTTAKGSLVAAINELVDLVQANGGAGIDDGAGAGNTTATWSADKILSAIAAAQAAVKDELVNGAGAALDTLKELADALGNDPSFATTIAGEIANRVRFDAAQTLTNGQKAQARENIGAFGATELGDPDRDLVIVYTAAKV